MHNKQWELQINLSYDNKHSCYICKTNSTRTLFRVQQQFNELVSQWNIQLIDHTGAESDAVRFQFKTQQMLQWSTVQSIPTIPAVTTSWTGKKATLEAKVNFRTVEILKTNINN